jgi:uridine kinase
MVGDKIIVKPYHLPPAITIFDFVKNAVKDQKFTFTISGESGCGKSTLAIALKMVLEENGLSAYTFHMDDYFKLPPTSNHNQRVEDISHVGPHEVDLALLQSHIETFKAGNQSLIKPLVHYKENEIKKEIVDFSNIDVVIVEGTYTSILDNIDCKVFIDRTYKDTYAQRVERAREEMTSFIESVLEIEHLIISKHISFANVVLDKDYNVKTSKSLKYG